MTTDIYKILDLARLAPSVHNTQPWEVHIVDRLKLSVTLSKDRKLEDGDPTGREAYISLGIFSEALRESAKEDGILVQKLALKDGGFDIQFKRSGKKGESLGKFLRTRCSDRSIYRPVNIDNETIKDIEKSNVSRSVKVRVVTDKLLIDKIADFTGRGISVALSSPSFRSELSKYLTIPGFNKKTGISVRSLYIPTILELIEPVMMKAGIGLTLETRLEKKRWLSASGIVLIMAEGDMPKYWFEVGRSYLRASLVIESHGLSQATSAAIVEASNYHEDIEQDIGTNMRILSIMRIGQGANKRYYSPRLSAEEIVT